MKLVIGKVSTTEGWSNKDFNVKYLHVSLAEGSPAPEIKIYFADKSLILEKELFSGMPFLQFKPDAAAPDRFKLMPGIALDRRYAFYLVRVSDAGVLKEIELMHNLS